VSTTKRKQGPGSVSVILPVHNNAATLEPLCAGIRSALADWRVEIIGVDDGSTDDSASILSEQDAVVISNRKSVGQNTALLIGLKRARFELACVMDADLQDPPEALPLLLGRLQETGFDAVFCNRQDRFRLTSKVFRSAIGLIYPELPPNPCLCFAVSKDARSAILSFCKPGDYLVAVIGALKLKADFVQVKRDQRAGGRSAYGALKRVTYAGKMLYSAIKLKFRALP